MTKHQQLLELARRRRSSCWPGYKNVGDYHDGAYDCDFVSPYTKSAGNVDADVMVLLQDWASDESLSGPFVEERRAVGHTPNRMTNVRLRELLRHHLGLDLNQIYASNVFPFVKPGSMSGPNPRTDMVRAAREFAIPQIKIVKPRLVICLGKAAFGAVAAAAGQRIPRSIAAAIDSPFAIGDTQVWCQAHTGQRGTNNRNKGGIDRVAQDWARMAATIA